MNNLGIILIIFAALLALQAIADKIKLPNAVLLVIVGLSLWFIPGLPAIELNPNVIFLLFSTTDTLRCCDAYIVA